MNKLEDSTKIELKERECVGVEWVNLAQDGVQLRIIVKLYWRFWFHKKARNILIC
jgi:hypothetical protein